MNNHNIKNTKISAETLNKIKKNLEKKCGIVIVFDKEINEEVCHFELKKKFWREMYHMAVELHPSVIKHLNHMVEKITNNENEPFAIITLLDVFHATFGEFVYAAHNVSVNKTLSDEVADGIIRTLTVHHIHDIHNKLCEINDLK